MGDKWEHSLLVPGTASDATTQRVARQLVGYGIRAVFSRPLTSRSRSMPIGFLQTHRGFPRKCPELYCTASIREEAADQTFCFHGRGQALSCYEGHRFAAFRFGRSMIIGKLDLYLARLGDQKWRRLITFPARTLYGRGTLRALWNAPFEEVLCTGSEGADSASLPRWRGFQRRFARQLSEADRGHIEARVRHCLDLCSEPMVATGQYVSAAEFACAAGHRALFSRTERGSFLASRLVLSYSQAAESL